MFLSGKPVLSGSSEAPLSREPVMTPGEPAQLRLPQGGAEFAPGIEAQAHEGDSELSLAALGGLGDLRCEGARSTAPQDCSPERHRCGQTCVARGRLHGAEKSWSGERAVRPVCLMGGNISECPLPGGYGIKESQTRVVIKRSLEKAPEVTPEPERHS
jgi:hypothetical protein